MYCTSSRVWSKEIQEPGGGEKKIRDFTFYSEPPGALVEISYDNGKTRQAIGPAGFPLKLDVTRLSASPKLTLYFQLSGYSPREIPEEADYFLSHNRYPADGAVKLISSSRTVTFFTNPPGAEISVSLPELHQVIPLGASGRPIRIDTSHFQEGLKYTFILKKKFYREKEETIGLLEFNADKDNNLSYPTEDQPIRLTPTIPLLVPLYYHARNNPGITAVIVSALLVLSGMLLFRRILPHYRKIRARLDTSARWDEYAEELRSDDPLCGATLGDYLIVKKLGKGAMGTIYRAVHRSAADRHEPVAIKIIRPEISQNDLYLCRFRREIEIGIKIEHPHILKTIAHGQLNGMLYIVMELAEGRPLSAKIVEGGLTLDTFFHFYRPILEAVQFAHEKGIVHRDLKPQNIFLTGESETVKVMDFGLARGESQTAITKTGAVLGTPAYMSPEQITNSICDSRSDQYALGVIAYELLTGRLPFPEDIPINTIFRHVTDDPLPLRKVRSDIPEKLDKIILRMLEKEPAKRFSSLLTIRDEIEAIIREKTAQEDSEKKDGLA